MAVASNVLGFEVVELWSDDANGLLHCTYVNAKEGLDTKYPKIIKGHYPAHKSKHVHSPQVTNYRVILICKHKRNLNSALRAGENIRVSLLLAGCY